MLRKAAIGEAARMSGSPHGRLCCISPAVQVVVRYSPGILSGSTPALSPVVQVVVAWDTAPSEGVTTAVVGEVTRIAAQEVGEQGCPALMKSVVLGSHSAAPADSPCLSAMGRLEPPLSCLIGIPTTCPAWLTNDSVGFPVTEQLVSDTLVNVSGMNQCCALPWTNPIATLRSDGVQGATAATVAGEDG